MIHAQIKPKRISDRHYKRLVMQNEMCIVAKLWRSNVSSLYMPPFDRWTCSGPYDFHHVKRHGEGKTGSKPDDRRGVKACRKHHDMAEHRAQFERDFGIDLEAEIAELNAKYPVVVKPKKERKVTPGVTVKRLKAWAKINALGRIQALYLSKPHGVQVVRVEVRKKD